MVPTIDLRLRPLSLKFKRYLPDKLINWHGVHDRTPEYITGCENAVHDGTASSVWECNLLPEL